MSVRLPGIYRDDVRPDDAPGFCTGVPAFLAPLPAGEPALLTAPTHLDPLRTALLGSRVPDVVAGFFAAGGRRCHLVPFDAQAHDGLAAAVACIESLDDADLIAAPDPPAALLDFQLRLLAACDGGPWICLLDPPARLRPEPALYYAAAREHAAALVGAPGSDSAALYFPWLRVGDGLVPPCGHVAGAIAASDARVGPHKAPAGDRLPGVTGLDLAPGLDDRRALAEQPINCIVAQPGRGLRIWGARTLSDREDRRPLGARRLVLTIRRRLARTLAGLAFEPNDAALWRRLARAVDAYLRGLYERGALRGASPEDAYVVRCDEHTNPPESRDAGQLTAEIEVAPAAARETIVLRMHIGPQNHGPTFDEPID